MLSSEEKREMLEDAMSQARRQNFRVVREKDNRPFSFDDYLLFLNSVQELFAQFKISHHKTGTKLNKL